MTTRHSMPDRRFRVALAAAFCLTACAGFVRLDAQIARDSFFKSDDVVALTGGEEMVTMGEDPELEVLVLRQPGLATVKFRNLACEGDTVFEQFRQLNFPAWPEQLKNVGATVVITQFGKMESLDGIDGIPRFVQAYEKLIDVFEADERRVVVVSPSAFCRPTAAPDLPWKDAPDLSAHNETLGAYVFAIENLARRRGHRFVKSWFSDSRAGTDSRDGVHPGGLDRMAVAFGRELGFARLLFGGDPLELRAAVVEKNRLWSNYWRPQNWAFLHGDRTEQLFSRDHRDTNVRRFVIEIEKYVPLIARQELEIVRLATESTTP